jgi:hypothetical protein
LISVEQRPNRAIRRRQKPLFSWAKHAARRFYCTEDERIARKAKRHAVVDFTTNGERCSVVGLEPSGHGRHERHGDVGEQLLLVVVSVTGFTMSSAMTTASVFRTDKMSTRKADRMSGFQSRPE